MKFQLAPNRIFLKPENTLIDILKVTLINVYPTGIARCNLLINENFTLTCNQNIFRVEKLIKDLKSNGSLITFFDQIKPFGKMRLTSEATRIMNTPNAGGSSIESEALSFEILKRYFNAHLLKTEMEVEYFPQGGSMNDYVIYLFDTVVGVSVTRAMKYQRDKEFDLDDAFALLSKKLKGINQSSKNSLIKWDKQILHVWTMSEKICETLLLAWFNLNEDLRSNTVLLITCAENSVEVFTNQVAKVKKKRKRSV